MEKFHNQNFKEIEYIFLDICVLRNNYDEIIEILSEFIPKRQEFYKEKYYLYYEIPVNINVYSLMLMLDEILHKFPNTRYILNIKDKNKKFCSSIRINKKGEKRYIKQQTKNMILI